MRGEIVLVVTGAPSGATHDASSVEALFARLTAEGQSTRQAVKEIARLTGLPAREVYTRVLAAKGRGAPEEHEAE